jgi:hypothetical protein
VLAGGAVAALSGCGSTGGPRPSPTPAPENPEHVLLRGLIADKERTIAVYSALITGGDAELVPFRERHQAHLNELRKRLPASAASPAASVTPSTSGSATPAAGMSLSRLRDAERRSASQRTRQIAGVSPALAQLIASIGACEAAHAVALPRSR